MWPCPDDLVYVPVGGERLRAQMIVGACRAEGLRVELLTADESGVDPVMGLPTPGGDRLPGADRSRPPAGAEGLRVSCSPLRVEIGRRTGRIGARSEVTPPGPSARVAAGRGGRRGRRARRRARHGGRSRRRAARPRGVCGWSTSAQGEVLMSGRQRLAVHLGHCSPVGGTAAGGCRGSREARAGVTMGGDLRLSGPNAIGDDWRPAVAYSETSGVFLVVREDERDPFWRGADIYGRRVGADGKAIGAGHPHQRQGRVRERPGPGSGVEQDRRTSSSWCGPTTARRRSTAARSGASG